MPQTAHIATATPVRLFPNDFTNVADREEQKRKREEEARAVALAAERERNRTKSEKDLREDIERLKKQITGFEVDKREEADHIKRLKKQITDLEVDKKEEVERLTKQITGLEVDKKNAEARANKLEGEKNSAQTDAQQQKNKVTQLENEKLDPKNNLDPGYHGKLVMIVNIGGRRAIDFGKGSEAWTYEWNWDNSNQKLQLFKVDPNDKKSPWRIKCAGNGRYLSAWNYNQGQVPQTCDEQSLEATSGWPQYYIGSAKAGEYVIENINSNMVLDQSDTSRGGGGGKTLYQYTRWNNSHQLWNIIRMEPDVA